MPLWVLTCKRLFLVWDVLERSPFGIWLAESYLDARSVGLQQVSVKEPGLRRAVKELDIS
jgi:hypothetical protein